MGSLPTGTVTFLFTDIEGSTRLLQQLRDTYADVLVECRRLVRTAIQERGGQEVDTEGDAVFAAFPSAREALIAAVTAQQSILRHPWPDGAAVRVRMGLHTGEAHVAESGYVGMDVHRAARICAAAHGGQILISDVTQGLVTRDLSDGVRLRDLGEHRLKDLAHPHRLFQVLAPDLSTDFPPVRSLDAHPHNLPIQLTSFIGRGREIAEVKRLLGAARLVTLTGSGGAGKTRLALQVAADVVEGNSDGVWLAEFAPIADPVLVPKTVASAMNVPEQPGRDMTETLVDALRPKALLLVLDNCEHLLAACRDLAAALLRTCPQVRILATSRQGLGVPGETLWRVPSLSVPEDTTRLPPPDKLLLFEAVRLFVDRAVMIDSGFMITSENAPALARVSQRLDGIPLAIELAAARVKVLAVEQIAARLDDRFRLLTGGSRMLLPRQQTLRAAIDWSYDLLSQKERAVLRRLSVFAGGCTLEAVEVVCIGNSVEASDILDLLTQLVDKSLVLVETRHDEARYRLLETIGEYGRDRLAETGEAMEVQRRHRDWYLALAEQAELKLQGSEQVVWLRRLEMEHDNLRAALEWSLTDARDAEAGMRLSAALAYFWRARDYVAEGSRWLERALSHDGDVPASARAKAVRTLAYMLVFQGQFERAGAWAEKGLDLSRQLDDKEGIGQSLWTLGMVALSQRDFDRAKALYSESLAYCREAGDSAGAGNALNQLGEQARSRGDYEAARSFYEESLVIRRATGDKGRIAATLGNLGSVEIAQGHCRIAAVFLRESLTMRREIGSKKGVIGCLAGFAGVAVAEDQLERAARLLGAAEVLLGTIGIPLEHPDQVEFESRVKATRAALGDAAFATAWAEGRAMTLEQAIEYALAAG